MASNPCSPPEEKREHLNFSKAFREELKTLRHAESVSDPVIRAAHRARLCGLAFSGGGIRSATFNLGVLQGLTRLGILKKFDYLSTVSGGGYIGSWLAAWIWREAQASKDSSHAKPFENSSATLEEKRSKQMDNLFVQPGLECTRDGYETPARGDESIGRDIANMLGKDQASLDGGSASEQPAHDGFGKVIQALKESNTNSSEKGPFAEHHRKEANPIAHLREFSNYLTPRRGWWNNDTWTLGVAYIRNLVLTFSVLLGTLIAGVLLVHSSAVLYSLMLETDSIRHQWTIFGAFVLTLSTAAFFCAWDMATCQVLSQKDRDHIYCSMRITGVAIGTAIVSMWFGAAGLWHVRQDFLENFFKFTTLVLIIITIMAVIIGGILGKFVAYKRLKVFNKLLKADAQGWRQETNRILAALAGSIGLVLSICLSVYWMKKWPTQPDWLGAGRWLAVVWGPLAGLLAYTILATIFVGAAGNNLIELEKEWLARMFAAITKWTGLCCVMTALVLYAPIAIKFGSKLLYGLPNGILGALWSGISAAGAILARSGGNAASIKTRRWIARAVLAVSPVVFVVGLVSVVSWGLNEWWPAVLNTSNVQAEYWQVLPKVTPQALLGCLGAGAVVFTLTIGWSYLVGVNTFSLHALYGNRLVRAFLGASNLKRRAHPFIGFDPQDNEVLLAALKPKTPDYQGPFLIINAAINLVQSARLAWQQRKAGSFIFTPLYCGYEFPSVSADNGYGEATVCGGFVPSGSYADGEGGQGISLGKAMTISGAAASPNMGYHSSPALAFLMTIFNVRLGWWLPNTGLRKPGLWRQRGPTNGLIYLWNELLGRTDAKRDFVYVSDGGHFENLGIYELVRRRARFILASDAAADVHMKFGDLGNAIERCRTDFGISIEIDVEQLKPDAASGLSRWHCAVGKIKYSDVDPTARDGILFYVKASLTGDEPQDVTAYADEHEDFPHESTADQWFDESQFESYRALGQHIIERIMSMPVLVINERQEEEAVLKGRLKAEKEKEPSEYMESLFRELQKMWHPPMASEAGPATDLDAQLAAIIDEMRSDGALAFLDLQLYPDVGRTISGSQIKLRSNPFIPRSYSELRAGFCFCKRLLQFMQEVYLNRELDVTYNTPASRGWMNLLRRWSLSRMLRYTWSVTAGTYSARFQTFCEHHLGFDVGHLKWAKPLLIQNPDAWQNEDTLSGIDFYESLVIKEFLRQYRANTEELKADAPFWIYPLIVETENPILADLNACASINAGFAIVGPAGDGQHAENKILYVRIRPTMRSMGYLRQALDSRPKGNVNKPMQFELPSKEFKIESIDIQERDAWRQRIYREIYALRFNRDNFKWLENLDPDTVADESLCDPGFRIALPVAKEKEE